MIIIEFIKDLIYSFGPLAFVLFIPVISTILFIPSLILTIVFNKNKIAFTIFLMLTLIFSTTAITTFFSIVVICFTFYLLIAGM